VLRIVLEISSFYFDRELLVESFAGISALLFLIVSCIVFDDEFDVKYSGQVF